MKHIYLSESLINEALKLRHITKKEAEELMKKVNLHSLVLKYKSDTKLEQTA